MKIGRLCSVLMAAVMFVGALACTKKQSGVEANVENGNGNANLQGAQQGGIAGAKVKGGRMFSGFISDKKVRLALTREGEQLSGTYSYQKIGSDISLKGQVKGEEFTLQEFDNGGKQTGEFKGKWSEPAYLPGAELEGTWSKPGGKGEPLSFYATEQMIEFTNGLRFVSKEMKEEDKKKKYSVDMEYLELTGANMPNADKFNQGVKSLATKEVSDFKKGMDEMSAEDMPTDPEMSSYISMSPDVVLATDELVSVLFSVSNYEAGAAHPNSYGKVYNYDLKNGKTIQLGDLFKPGSNYLEAISRYAVSDLKKRLGPEGVDDEWIQNGAGPDAANYQGWNISKKGLAITYDPYQVASYASGPQHIIVPYSVLKEMIKPDGPLAPLMNKG